MAAYFSVLQPGDRILGMNLAHGGHLTHGMALNFSGRLYEVHAYGVRQDTERIDYDAMEAQAREVRPEADRRWRAARTRGCGTSSGWRISPHGVGAILFIDMAHIAGLVAAGVHPSPFPHADIVTTTTHKTLRGPRGGMIFARDELPEGLDPTDFPAFKTLARRGRSTRRVFPGVQGGPLMHVIAGKAVALQARAPRSRSGTTSGAPSRTRPCSPRPSPAQGARVVSGGTDNHLMLVDVTPLGVTGKEAEHLLDEIGITVNKNAIPFDPLPAEHRLRHPARHARPRPRAASARTRCAPSAGSSSRRSAARDDAGRPASAGRARSREIVARFPVPGLPARDRAPHRCAVTSIGPDAMTLSSRDRTLPADRRRVRRGGRCIASS